MNHDHALLLAAFWACAAGAAIFFAFLIGKAVHTERRRPRYGTAEDAYRAERQARREREDAAWKRVWYAVMSVDDEPLPPEWDEHVVRNPRTPQQEEQR